MPTVRKSSNYSLTAAKPKSLAVQSSTAVLVTTPTLKLTVSAPTKDATSTAISTGTTPTGPSLKPLKKKTILALQRRNIQKQVTRSILQKWDLARAKFWPKHEDGMCEDESKAPVSTSFTEESETADMNSSSVPCNNSIDSSSTVLQDVSPSTREPETSVSPSANVSGIEEESSRLFDPYSLPSLVCLQNVLFVSPSQNAVSHEDDFQDQEPHYESTQNWNEVFPDVLQFADDSEYYDQASGEEPFSITDNSFSSDTVDTGLLTGYNYSTLSSCFGSQEPLSTPVLTMSPQTLIPKRVINQSYPDSNNISMRSSNSVASFLLPHSQLQSFFAPEDVKPYQSQEL